MLVCLFVAKCWEFCGHFWRTGENKIFCRIRDIRLPNLLLLLAFGSSSWILRDPQIAAFWLILNFSFLERCGEPTMSRIKLTPFQKKANTPIETISWSWQGNPSSYKHLFLTLKSPLCSCLGYNLLQYIKVFTGHISLMNFTVTYSRYDCDSGNSFSQEMKMNRTL